MRRNVRVNTCDQKVFFSHVIEVLFVAVAANGKRFCGLQMRRQGFWTNSDDDI